MPTKEEKILAVLCHLSILCLPVLGPLVLVLVSGSPFVRDHAKEALVFQLFLTIALAVSSLLLVVLIGIVMGPILILIAVVTTIVAIISAWKGKLYRYPVTSVFAQKI
jgi:uncharacterized protein